MIHINFDPANLTGPEGDWWTKWEKRARNAIKAAITSANTGETMAFRQVIWKELKDWLLANVFRGKCAYCETPIEAGFYGDAEHYRPKGAVMVKNQRIVIGGKPHGGYYWLAYHWKNLIPSCEKCNSGSGKGSQFPIAGTAHIDRHQIGRDDPDALDAIEQPLLLHPYRDEPTSHLIFGLNGVIAAKNNDPRGEATIELCDLKREPLREARKMAQEDAWILYLDHASKGKTDEFAEKFRRRPYFAAVAAYIKTMWEQTRPQL